MEYSCEAFLDYAYEEDIVMEAFHPIKNIQNILTKIIAAIQKLLNRIRGLRAIWLPKIHLDLFNRIHKEFNATSKELNAMIKSKNLSEIGDLEDATRSVKNSSEFGMFLHMDTSNFGKDDYVQIANGKEIIDGLNNAIHHVTFYKTQLNAQPEAKDEVKRIAIAIMEFYSLEIPFYSKVLKFHPPLKDPKNVNKLGGVGSATVHA